MDAINQPLLDVHDLSVAFHQPSGVSIAVDHVSFQIRRGECVALVGESGSGKSVSALSILRLLPYPTASHPSGHIRFKGQELLGMSENEIRGIRGNDISITRVSSIHESGNARFSARAAAWCFALSSGPEGVSATQSGENNSNAPSRSPTPKR